MPSSKRERTWRPSTTIIDAPEASADRYPRRKASAQHEQRRCGRLGNSEVNFMFRLLHLPSTTERSCDSCDAASFIYLSKNMNSAISNHLFTRETTACGAFTRTASPS